MEWFTIEERGYYLPEGNIFLECPSCGNLMPSKHHVLEIEGRIGCIKCLR